MPREIPREDQVIRQGKIFKNIKKKTRTEKIDNLYREFFERNEEINDLRREIQYLKEDLSKGIAIKGAEEKKEGRELEKKQKEQENKSILELIEAQRYRYLPINWDEGRYFS